MADLVRHSAAIKVRKVLVCCQFAQNVVQNAAVLVVLYLVRRIDPAKRGEGKAGAIGAGRFNLDILTRRYIEEFTIVDLPTRLSGLGCPI